MAYLDGNVIVFQVEFKTTATSTLVDPSVVEFSYQVAGGSFSAPITYASASTPSIGVVARISAGIYQTWVSTASLSGLITGLWEATGTGASAVEDSITVGQTIGSGYTFGDLIENVARRAAGAVRTSMVWINQSGGISSTATSLPITGPQAGLITVGSILGLEMELALVTDISGDTLTIIRGYQGSTQATHSNGATVYINPEFSKFDIGVAINDDLRSLSSQVNGLYRVGTAAIDYNPTFQGYDLSDLPSNYLDIINVRYREANPQKRFPIITSFEQANFNGLTDADFPSGNALLLKEDAYPGLPMYVTYSAPFLKLVNWTDDIINTPGVNDDAAPLNGYPNPTVPNLAYTMTDIPVLGATAAVVQPREVSRNDMGSQDDPRKAQEVVAGAVMGSTNAMLARRTARIDEEAMRLYNKYTNQRRY